MVRPYLAIDALKMSRKSSSATLDDLSIIDDVVDKIKSRGNVVNFKRIGKKEDLIITGVGDASYKAGEKAIGGNIVMIQCENTGILEIETDQKSLSFIERSGDSKYSKTCRQEPVSRFDDVAAFV